MESSTALISFIIGLPLLGFLIHGIAGLSSKEYRTKHIFIGTLSTLFVFIPFLLLLSIFFQFTAESEPLYVSLFRWVDVGSLQIDAAYRIDQLSLVMSLVVTGVGSLIHLYSMGYMSHDKGYWKFFAYLNLFIFAMLNLVLSNNMLLMFLGWEGVGVCSYLLIGFWYTDIKKIGCSEKSIHLQSGWGFCISRCHVYDFRNGWQSELRSDPRSIISLLFGSNFLDLTAHADWRHRKKRSVSTFSLASGCHGWTNSCIGPDPCGDDGYLGNLSLCPNVPNGHS